MPGLRERIFGAIQRYPLKGWAPDRTRTRAPRREKPAAPAQDAAGAADAPAE